MTEALKDKVALITGASSGIGRTIACLFALEGASILVADYNEAEGQKTVGIIGQTGGRADFYLTDVTKGEAVRGLFDYVENRFGGLDILVNNAGVTSAGNTLEATEENDFERVIAVNLWGVFLGIKYGVPLLRKRGGGRIINTASVAGLIGLANSGPYAASKAGVISMTKTAALEYVKDNIRVNCICPGYIDTPILDGIRARPNGIAILTERISQRQVIGRLGRAEEVAQVALYLASGPDFMTGTVQVIDGGIMAGS